MSMILCLTTISQTNIEAAQQNPALVWRFVAPDDPDLYTEAAKSLPTKGFFKKLFGKAGQSQDVVPELILAPGEGVNRDLDKAWHAIQFLLTGTAWEGKFPLGFLVLGGIELKDIEVGYGSPRLFSPADVARIDSAISMISPDDLCARFDGKAMTNADIYPNIWTGTGDSETIPYIRSYFKDLQECVKHAHEHGLGLIITIM